RTARPARRRGALQESETPLCDGPAQHIIKGRVQRAAVRKHRPFGLTRRVPRAPALLSQKSEGARLAEANATPLLPCGEGGWGMRGGDARAACADVARARIRKQRGGG